MRAVCRVSMVLLVVLLVVLLWHGHASAQSRSDFDLRIVLDRSEILGPPGSVVSRDVTGRVVLTTRVDGVQGWSFGVVVDPDPDLTMALTRLEFGNDVFTVQEGAPADIRYLPWYEAGDFSNIAGLCDDFCVGIEAAAFTQGVGIDTYSAVTLPATEALEIAEFVVHVEGVVPGGDSRLSGRLRFTDTIGVLPVPTIVIHTGLPIAPAQQLGAEIGLRSDGTVPGDERFRLAVELDATEITVSPGSDISTDVAGRILLTTLVEGVQGWSFGAVADRAPEFSVHFSELEFGGDLLSVKGGAPADVQAQFWYETWDSPTSEGQCRDPCGGIHAGAFTQAVTIDGAGVVTLPATSTLEVGRFTLHVEGVAPHAGDVACGRVRFRDDVGELPVSISVVHDGVEAIPTWKPVRLCLHGENIGHQFPGDSNQDGQVDMSDAITLLGYLYTGQTAVLPCGDGSSTDSGNVRLLDWNDDDAVDLSDGVGLLRWKFSTGSLHPLGVSCQPMAECPDSCKPADGG